MVCGLPTPLVCGVDDTAALAVNAALHGEESTAAPHVNRSLAHTHTHTHNAELDAGQVASTVFQIFDMTRPGIESKLPALVAGAQQTIQFFLFELK